MISVVNLTKSYGDTVVLQPISFDIKTGESVALLGPSGSGKTTLLSLLGLLDTPTGGDVIFDNTNYSGLSAKQRNLFRRTQMSFIFQFHNLLPELNILDNAALPLILNKKTVKDARQESEQILKKLNMDHRLTHKPHQISGGEQQRVAIARALIAKPKLILADEPTGNLDPQNAQNVCTMLLNKAKESGTSLIMATHNIELAKQLDRSINL